MERLKEKIKLHTEWLRGFFTLFVLIGSGVATLVISKSYLIYELDKKILNFGIYIDFAIIIIIVVINMRIYQFINKLPK